MNQDLEFEVSRLHAEICRGLADPTRVLILYVLASGRQNVTQLAGSLEISQPAASRHLKVLRERGMVIADRVDAAVEYRLADRRLIEAMALLRGVLRDRLARQAELAGALAAG
jgi:ArsR family transcriptional regulator